MGDHESNLVVVTCANHHKTLVSELWKFYQENHAVDLDIECWGGERLRTHRLLLDIFLSTDKLLETAATFQPDCSLDSLLEFLYNGTIIIPKNDIGSLHDIAKKSEFKMLVEALDDITTTEYVAGSCQNQIGNTLKPQSIVSETPRHISRKPVGRPPRKTTSTIIRKHLNQSDKYLHKRQSIKKNRHEYLQDRCEFSNHSLYADRELGSNPLLEPLTLVETVIGTPLDNCSNQSASISSDRSTVGLNRRRQTSTRVDVNVDNMIPQNTELDNHAEDDGETLTPDSHEWHMIVNNIKFEHDEQLNESNSHVDVVSETNTFSEQVDEFDETFLKDVQFEPRTQSPNRGPRERSTKAPLSKNRLFYCEECNKGFSRKFSLINHARVHTGERPFICPVCSRAFSLRTNLVVHLRTHSGEQPHRCDVCNASFGRLHTLRRHQWIHNGHRPFECGEQECRRTFASAKCLAKHSRTHLVPPKPFPCDECGKAFTLRNNLRRHCQAIHGTF